MELKKTLERLETWLSTTNEINEANKKTIKEFIAVKKLQHSDPSTVKSYLQVLCAFGKWVKENKLEEVCKDEKQMVQYFAEYAPRKLVQKIVKGKDGKPEKVIEERLRKKPFKEGTLHLYQIRLMHFMRWLYKLDKTEIPKSMKWVRKPKDKLLSAKDIWSPAQVQELVNACPTQMERAVIKALFESKDRNATFTAWKNGSLKVKDNYASITVTGKGGREYSMFLTHSLPDILKWIELHPDKDNDEAFMWIGKNGKKLTREGLNLLLKKAAKRAGFDKKIWPHLLRHSGITHSVKQGHNIQALKIACGHSPSSNTLVERYSHLSDSDSEEEFKRVNGLIEPTTKDISLEKITCPRCKKEWPSGQKYCSCNFIFDRKEIEKREVKEKDKVKAMIEMALKEKGI